MWRPSSHRPWWRAWDRASLHCRTTSMGCRVVWSFDCRPRASSCFHRTWTDTVSWLDLPASGSAVAGTIGRIEHRHRVAGAPDHLVGRGIIGARDPHGAAADLPGVVLVLPGLAARLARRRYDVFAPDDLAAGAVERSDPIAHAAIAAGRAHDDLVLYRERRGGDLHGRLGAGVGFPDHLAVVLVGGVY